MGHSKLPWIERIDNPIFSEKPVSMPEYVIYGKGGECLVASVWAKTKLGDEEAKANANLIITAVNVMPELRVFLEKLQVGDLMTERLIQQRAGEFLEKLEAVE